MSLHHRLRVGVNAASAHLGGGLSYLAAQLPQLERLVDLTIFALPEARETLAPLLTTSKLRTVPRWARRLPLRLLWEQLAFPLATRRLDVIYNPGNMATFVSRRPQVVLFQNAYHFGAAAPALFARHRATAGFRFRVGVQRWAARASASRATLCVTVSHSLASDLIGDVDVGERVRVVLSGPGSVLPPSLPSGSTALPGTTSLASRPPVEPVRPIVLTVAHDYPHKDWEGLVDAWASPLATTELWLVGNAYQTREAFAEGLSARGKAHWIGPVTDSEQLGDLYRSACLYLAHSFLEAFPLTPLEAMRAGTPVVAADIPSHREVCGDAAVYYDPYDALSILQAVELVASDGALRAELTRRAHQHVKTFSWHGNAAHISEVLAEASQCHPKDGSTCQSPEGP